MLLLLLFKNLNPRQIGSLMRLPTTYYVSNLIS